MLPPVIDEGDCFPFKFWFSTSIQDGMYYRNELFYRVYTVDTTFRAKLYHYACKLSKHNNVVVTASDRQCSVWVSLRNLDRSALPPHTPIDLLFTVTDPSANPSMGDSVG